MRRIAAAFLTAVLPCTMAAPARGQAVDSLGQPFIAIYAEAAPGDTGVLTFPDPGTGGTVAVRPEPLLTVDDLTSAEVQRERTSGDILVRTGVTPAAAERLSAATRELLDRRVAVVVDGRVHRTITVRSAIRVLGPIMLLTPETEAEARSLARRIHRSVAARVHRHPPDDPSGLAELAEELSAAAVRHLMQELHLEGEGRPPGLPEAVLDRSPVHEPGDERGDERVVLHPPRFAEAVARRVGLIDLALDDAVPCPAATAAGCIPAEVRVAFRVGPPRAVEGRFVVPVERVELAEGLDRRPVATTLYDVTLDLVEKGWVVERVRVLRSSPGT